jgi:uncharacterized protein (TIGR03437 family)
VDWIVLASGAFGSGNSTVQWIVRPNYGSQPRTGTITINRQTYTVEQSAALPEPLALERLNFNVVDAAYSAAIDRIVAVSTSPDELHIYDPVMGSDSVVPLIMPPLAVSVAPDGLHAAVGHDGWISYIDLQTPAVLQVFPIVTDVHHVLLAGNGYIYAFPLRDWSDIYSLEIAAGNLTNTSAIYEGRIPRLEPNEKYFYLSGGGWFSKWEITKGVAVSIENNPGAGFGGNYWMSQDGSQLISANGKVYATSDVLAQDVKYTGTYPNVSSISWAANTTALNSTAVIPMVQGPGATPMAGTQVQFYGDAYLGYTGTLPLLQFSAGGKNYPRAGLFAFWTSSGTVLYVIERADPASMLLSTDAIYTINPAAPSAGCNAAPLGALSTISPTGGFGGTVVMAGAGCPWSATSDSSWLVINAGGIGAGMASVSWSTAPSTGAARSATVTVGGSGYTVTQLGAGTPQLTISQTTLTIAPKLEISPPSITFQYTLGDPAPSTTLSLADGTSSGTTFYTYAQGSVSLNPASGTLPVTIQVSVLASLAGTYTATVLITTGGQTYTVPVKFVVTGVPVSVTSITNDADFSPGPVSPGELVVIWGSGLGPATLTSFMTTPAGAIPRTFAGTTVTFNNYTAPVVYTSAGSVCVIVPYEVAGLSSATVVVRYNGSAPASFTQSVAPTAPHFFTTSYAPVGQIVGLDSDYSVNSANNPAPPGSVVVLYATGEGVTSPPGVDGTVVGSMLTQPLANAVVMIGGQRAELLYAGGAPGIVEGVLQVNARIPAGTSSGNAPVSLQIGSAVTPAGATIAVR